MRSARVSTPPLRRQRNQVVGWVCVGLFPFALFALIVALIYTPAEVASGQHLIDLQLPVKTCPGCAMCGLSRGFSACMRGDFGAAARLNPLVLFMWPAAVLITLLTPTFLLAQTQESR